jgi:hypothetical protein
MGLLVQCGGRAQSVVGKVVLGRREEPWARRNSQQIVLGGSGGGVPKQVPCGMSICCTGLFLCVTSRVAILTPL